MDRFLVAAAAVFAAYRLARLVSVDDGPFDILLRIRVAMGVYDYGPNGAAVRWTGRLLGCPHCVGIWLAGVVALLVYGFGWDTLLAWLAIAGAQSWLTSVVAVNGRNR